MPLPAAAGEAADWGDWGPLGVGAQGPGRWSSPAECPGLHYAALPLPISSGTLPFTFGPVVDSEFLCDPNLFPKTTLVPSALSSQHSPPRSEWGLVGSVWSEALGQSVNWNDVHPCLLVGRDLHYCERGR